MAARNEKRLISTILRKNRGTVNSLFSRLVFIHFFNRISWENLIKDQSIYPVVIINFLVIVLTFSLDDVLILLGEH